MLLGACNITLRVASHSVCRNLWKEGAIDKKINHHLSCIIRDSFQRAASVGILNRGGRASLEEEESWEFGDDKYAVVGCVFWASELLNQPWRPVWTWMMMCKRG